MLRCSTVSTLPSNRRTVELFMGFHSMLTNCWKVRYIGEPIVINTKLKVKNCDFVPTRNQKSACLVIPKLRVIHAVKIYRIYQCKIPLGKIRCIASLALLLMHSMVDGKWLSPDSLPRLTYWDPTWFYATPSFKFMVAKSSLSVPPLGSQP